MLVKPIISMIFEKPREAGAVVWTIMEIVGNVGKTNIFHCGPPPSGTQVLVFMLLNRRADLGTGGGGGTIYIYIYIHNYMLPRPPPQIYLASYLIFLKSLQTTPTNLTYNSDAGFPETKRTMPIICYTPLAVILSQSPALHK